MADNNKIQEEIIKADIKEVKRLWKSNIQDNSLESLLEKMTKEELVRVAKRYSIKGLTSLKKAEVVERIKTIVLEKYEQALSIMDEDTLKFIEDLIDNNGQKVYECNDIVYSNYLRNRGLVFTGTIDDELFVILPKEMMELFEEKINRELYQKARLNKEIIRSIAGMIYYYGVMDINNIKDTLEKVFLCEFDIDFIKALALNGEELGYDYVIDEEVLYHIDVEDVEKLIQAQKLCNSDYYKFDKKSLIKAGEPDYIEENKQAEKLKKVFKELFVIDNNILREEMDSFIIAIKNEMSKEEAIECFLEAYEIESEEEKEIFKYELEIFAKSIKRWTLKGNSENEIKKNEQRVVNESKIGRNDPCVCGSGKKYKKCCGK